MNLGVDLDAEVRRVDPDRWLASRFVPAGPARDDLIALYAFDHELVRAGAGGRSPGAGAVRLAWWLEAVEEGLAGDPVRRHPTAEALAMAIARHDLPRGPFEAIIAARTENLAAQSLSADAALVFAGATEGPLAQLAAHILGAGDRAASARPAGVVWGLILARRTGAWADAGIARRLTEALAVARTEARKLPARSFPAVLPASLARLEVGPRAGGSLARRWRLTSAALTGRL